MAEKPISNRNLQPLDSSRKVADLPVEFVSDISEIESQFVASLEDLVEKEISDAKDELSTNLETQTLQERYGTSYDPYKVVTGIASIAMFTANPELIKRHLEDETVKAIEKGSTNMNDEGLRNKEIDTMSKEKTIYRENGLAYAQDQPELKRYASEATRMIDALISGDDSLLAVLPPEFAEALRVRIHSYENDINSDERDAMISVAVNGLSDKNGDNL